MSAGGDVLHGEDLDDPIGDWTVGNIVTTLVPLLAALSVLQMVSGTVLESFEEELLANPALLVLVPVMIGTAGNLGSIMCARLSTQLHLGTLEFSPDNPAIRANVGAVMGLAATVFVLLGIASWAIGRALGGTLGLGTLLLVTIVSGMLLAVWVVVVSSVAVYASYRLGYDPDDTTIPVVTNVCDISGVLILFTVVWLVV
ncbi:magnesium transporter [Halosolutus amylolyticus]|uniref:Magnesium transporter n=1 Tax=Halosolutus amylolyticus TaxID=2932267 RepID=A0ABD5PL76_9EURY|nr:magnesium transporter [Halosolutus amylolyticus]